MVDWSDKVVVVTGASEGLGFSVAEAFARRGTKLMLAARRIPLLEQAKSRLGELLRRRDVDTHIVPTDVTRPDQVAALVAATLAEFGRIDVWANCAGKSDRGRAMDCTPERYREFLELNFLAVVECSRAAVPHLLASRGSLVNIGSLAAKTASPFMGAYAPSKHALAAYTQQLRLEHDPALLHVLFVCPGPIARDEPRCEPIGADAQVPESARAPGGGVKLRLTRPDQIANDIVWACERRRTIELVYPRRARLLFAIQQLSARGGDWVVRRKTSAN